MDYQINNSVLVFDSSSPKVIVDYEIICNKKIYYMNDNTSYSSEQILNIITEKNFNIELIEQKLQNQDHVNKLVVNSVDYLKNAGTITKTDRNELSSIFEILLILFFILSVYLVVFFVIFY
jgi:aspartokinase